MSRDDGLDVSVSPGVAPGVRGRGVRACHQQEVHHLSVLDPARDRGVFQTQSGVIEVGRAEFMALSSSE